MAKLTAKQERFCAEYVTDFNATQAAIRAGYSEKTSGSISSENLQKLEIQAEIQRLTAKTAAKLELTAESVLRDIQAVKQDAMKQIFDKEQNQVMADRAAALKACELEGKYLKMFTDKQEISGAIAVSHSARDLTDDELASILKNGH